MGQIKTAPEMLLVPQQTGTDEEGVGKSVAHGKLPGHFASHRLYKADWLVESAMGQVNGKNP